MNAPKRGGVARLERDPHRNTDLNGEIGLAGMEHPLPVRFGLAFEGIHKPSGSRQVS